MNNLHFYIGGRGYGKAYKVMKRYNEAKDIFNIRLSSESKQSINNLLDILQGNKWNEVERAYLDDKPIGSDKE